MFNQESGINRQDRAYSQVVNNLNMRKEPITLDRDGQQSPHLTSNNRYKQCTQCWRTECKMMQESRSTSSTARIRAYKTTE